MKVWMEPDVRRLPVIILQLLILEMCEEVLTDIFEWTV